MYLVLLLTTLLISTQIELVKTDNPLIVVTMYERDLSRLLTQDHATADLSQQVKILGKCPGCFVGSKASHQSYHPFSAAQLSLFPRETTQDGCFPFLTLQTIQDTPTLTHKLLEYSHNATTGLELLTSPQPYSPSLSADSLLHLGFPLEYNFQSPSFHCIWKEIITSSRVSVVRPLPCSAPQDLPLLPISSTNVPLVVHYQDIRGTREAAMDW